MNQDGSRELLVGDSAVEYDEESQVAEDKKDEDQ